MVRCERCKKESMGMTMSMFNTQMICLECSEKEETHPKYEQARKAEIEEIKKGNLDFIGIGKPHDL